MNTPLTPGRIATAMKAGARNLTEGQVQHALFTFLDTDTKDPLNDSDWRELPQDRIEVVGACALGALAIGLGENPIQIAINGDNGIYWPKHAPDPVVHCPAPTDTCSTNEDLYDTDDFDPRTQGHRENLSHLIPHLNDECGWSIEMIADWIKKSVRFPLQAP